MGRRHSQWKLGWLVPTVIVLLALAGADAATLNKKARLREGPSKDTALLGWIDEGTTVAIESEHTGWYAVRTGDGRTGYVWQDHLNIDPSERPISGRLAVATSAPVVTTLPASPPPAAPIEAGPTAPAERIDRTAGLELERLRTEVARLAASQQELLQRLPREAGGVPSDPASESGGGPAAIFLGAGALIGWLAHWAFQARRDRRSRIRI